MTRPSTAPVVVPVTRLSPLKTNPRYVPSIIFVALSFAYAFVAWILWCPLLVLALLNSFTPIYFRRHSHVIVSQLCRIFNILEISLLEVCGVNFVEYGDIDLINKHENALILCNHPSLIDWLVIWSFLSKYSQLHRLRVVLKDELRVLPWIGYCIQLSTFIFMARNWASDQTTMTSLVEYYRTYHEYYTILIFPEGTNISSESSKSSASYAAKQNLRPLNELILPRITGTVHLFMELTLIGNLFENGTETSSNQDDKSVGGDHDHHQNGQNGQDKNDKDPFSKDDLMQYVDLFSGVDAIYDFTLSYTPTRNWHFVNVFTGGWPTVVHTHLRRIDILTAVSEIVSIDLKNDPNEYYLEPKYNPYNDLNPDSKSLLAAMTPRARFEAKVGVWLFQLWFRKDAQLTRFYDQVLELAVVGGGGDLSGNGDGQTTSPRGVQLVETVLDDASTALSPISSSSNNEDLQNDANIISPQSKSGDKVVSSGDANNHIDDKTTLPPSPPSISSANPLSAGTFTIPTSATLSDPLKPHNTLLFDKTTYIINNKATWQGSLPSFLLSLSFITTGLILITHIRTLRWFTLIWGLLSFLVLSVMKFPLFKRIFLAANAHEKKLIASSKSTTTSPHYHLHKKNDDHPLTPSSLTTPNAIPLSPLARAEYDVLQQVLEVPSIELGMELLQLQSKIENENYHTNNKNDTNNNNINGNCFYTKRQIRLQRGEELRQYYQDKIKAYAGSTMMVDGQNDGQNGQSDQNLPKSANFTASPSLASVQSSVLNLATGGNFNPDGTPVIIPHAGTNIDVSSRSLGSTTSTKTTQTITTSSTTSSNSTAIDNLIRQHRYNAEIYANDHHTQKFTGVEVAMLVQTIITVIYLYLGNQESTVTGALGSAAAGVMAGGQGGN